MVTLNSWQKLCLKSNHEDIFQHVVKFVLEQGRMKFVRPLYRYNTVFDQKTESYHSIPLQRVVQMPQITTGCCGDFQAEQTHLP